MASVAPVPAASSASFEGWLSCKTTRVLPPFSSKVTVVTGPSAPPSSLVQLRRECGFTSRYVPKNAAGLGLVSNTNRYLPPTRASISQESRVIPNDLGTHHRLNSSG